jgi:segregation and condensation protein A
MRKLIRFAGGWTELSSYIPEGWGVDPDKFRSATASNFAASLELVKAGEIELRQEELFDPIQVRKK